MRSKEDKEPPKVVEAGPHWATTSTHAGFRPSASGSKMFFRMPSMMRTRHLLRASLLLVASAGLLFAAQPQSHSQTDSEVPLIDGGAGPCELQLTVTTVDDKPVYDAKVKVHIAYRFGGFHKLDLEAGTNTEGKVKFVGLPSRVRRPPMEFQASKDQLVGALTYDPATECRATHKLKVELPKAEKPDSSQVQ
jgi:hypothetical protein